MECSICGCNADEKVKQCSVKVGTQTGLCICHLRKKVNDGDLEAAATLVDYTWHGYHGVAKNMEEAYRLFGDVLKKKNPAVVNLAGEYIMAGNMPAHLKTAYKLSDKAWSKGFYLGGYNMAKIPIGDVTPLISFFTPYSRK